MNDLAINELELNVDKLISMISELKADNQALRQQLTKARKYGVVMRAIFCQ